MTENDKPAPDRQFLPGTREEAEAVAAAIADFGELSEEMIETLHRLLVDETGDQEQSALPDDEAGGRPRRRRG